MTNNEALKIKHVEVLDALSKLYEECKPSNDCMMLIGRDNGRWCSHFARDLRQVKLPNFTIKFHDIGDDFQVILDEHSVMVTEQVEFESLLFIIGKNFRKTQITQKAGLYTVSGHIGMNAHRNWVYSNDSGMNNHVTLAGAFYGKDYYDDQ